MSSLWSTTTAWASMSLVSRSCWEFALCADVSKKLLYSTESKSASDPAKN